MHAVLIVLYKALTVYYYMIIIVAIMSWLISFNVINLYNPVVKTIWDGLNALVEPALRPIRRILPAMGNLDLSPLVLILLIMLVQQLIIEYGLQTLQY